MWLLVEDSSQKDTEMDSEQGKLGPVSAPRRIHQLVWVGLILLAGWFYWFQLWPALAVRACNARVSAKYDRPYEEAIAQKLGGGYEIEYRQCLREHGLAK